jgi:uncharacterized protein YcgI (DUF1989 family)
MDSHSRAARYAELPEGLERPPHRTLIPAGTGRAVKIASGGRAHVVNTLGRQVADTWAVTLPDAKSYLSMSHSRLAMGRIAPRAGDVLVDNLRRPLLRVVADTSPGRHDTLMPACDAQRYRDLGYPGEHRNCAANFLAALRDHGLADLDVPEPLNLFMEVPVARDGALTLAPSLAAPGDEVVLEALLDLLLVVSACPQDLVPISGVAAPPRQVDLYTDAPQN